MKRIIVAVALAATYAFPTAVLAVPKVGQAAPAFTLATVDGKTLALSSLKGRAVYLNFYATWCGPCNDEAPTIEKLNERYKRRGLTVLGINELENQQRAKEFLKKFKLTYSAVVDSDGIAGKAYGAIGLPVHVFIDRAGIVSTYRLGEMSGTEIELAIREILKA